MRCWAWWLSLRRLLNVRWLLVLIFLLFVFGLVLLFRLSLVLLLRGLAFWLMLPLIGIRWRDGSDKQRQDRGEDKLGCSFHAHLR